MIASTIDAKSLTSLLEGRWMGAYGTAPCPVCQPEGRRDQNALTLSQGAVGLLLHCKKQVCDFRDILMAVGLHTGNLMPPNSDERSRLEAERKQLALKRSEQARSIWAQALPIDGSLAETYLRTRGITCPLPKSLRFHPECWHGPTGIRHPAMVAAVKGSELPAIHRTFIKADGSGKAGFDGGDKLMLGGVAGGAVHLSSAPGRLVICEGIETGLSLLSGLLDEPATVWAALSAAGIARLRLPEEPCRLTIACDGDATGRSAALVLAERADALGWSVGVLDSGDGRDWNDHLNQGAAS